MSIMLESLPVAQPFPQGDMREQDGCGTSSGLASPLRSPEFREPESLILHR